LKYFATLLLLLVLLYSCKRKSSVSTVNNIFYDQAYEYTLKEKPDSAFIYYARAKDLFLQQKNSYGVAKCLVNMGIISSDNGDYYGAQEISINALKYFDMQSDTQRVYIKSNYNNLGVSTYNLENFDAALDFYDKALEFAKDSSDSLVIINNKAKIFEIKNEFDKSLKLYTLVLKGANNNGRLYARTLTNITYTKLRQRPSYNAAANYLKALQIREHEADLWGKNSSYSHLSDYYLNRKTDSALFYAQKMYEVALKLKSAPDKINALEKIIKVTPGKDVKKYFTIYYKLNDSLQISRQKAKNQFALIRYQTEKHKSDFLRAQAVNVQRKNDVLKRNIVVCILFFSLIIAYLWFMKRQRTLKQEKELEVKNTEIKYVKKIHDRVANKVYQVMSEVENTPLIDRDTVLDKLEGLYHITRDISYDVNDLDLNENYVDQLHKMIKSYESNKVGIITVGNEDDLWCDVSDAAKFEVYYIIQELLTNMRKHSHADSVVLKFYTENQQLKISYIDNGIGMQGANKKNGLSNTENRIKLIRGSIIFDSTQDQEFKVNLVFPLS
jgi:tetratricopeptide (TPR) repeat protein